MDFLKFYTFLWVESLIDILSNIGIFGGYKSIPSEIPAYKHVLIVSSAIILL